MVIVEMNEMLNECDPLDRPLLPYRIAKAKGITKGDIFHTDAGDLRAVEYIDWNPNTNHRVCSFACEEIKNS
jgi:hypothetical protein